MINNRTLIILALVLILLGGLSFWQQASHRTRTSLPSASTVLAGEFSRDDLNRLTLGQGGTDVSLEMKKTPAGWVVSSSWDVPANPERIDALLRTLSGLAGEFRSDNADVLADYGLADDRAVHIRGYGEQGEAFGLEVGNASQGQPGNFVRIPGSDAVYLTQNGVLSQLGIYGEPTAPQARHFLDLQAVKEDRLTVDRVILQDGGTVLEMAKEFAEVPAAEGDTTGAGPQIDRLTWEWKLVQPRQAALAKTKADGVLGTLVNIRAADVDDPGRPADDYGLGQPLRSATLVLEDGRQIVLEFGAHREADGDKAAGTWMRIQGQSTVWVVTDYTTKNIFKTVEDLLPE